MRLKISCIYSYKYKLLFIDLSKYGWLKNRKQILLWFYMVIYGYRKSFFQKRSRTSFSHFSRRGNAILFPHNIHYCENPCAFAGANNWERVLSTAWYRFLNLRGNKWKQILASAPGLKSPESKKKILK